MSRSSAPVRIDLPFFGLGMNLCSVLARVRRMLQHVRGGLQKTFRLMGVVVTASGYDLLVLQGREIRGQ